MNVDYLVIGQGICGTFLSYFLVEQGKRVLVIDNPDPSSASRVASGIINPVTGRRVVTTWMIDELLPFAIQAYEDMGEKLGCNVAGQIDMVSFHATMQMQSAWTERVAEGADYISHLRDTAPYSEYFRIPYGAGLTSPCLLVNLPVLLSAWRQWLKEKGMLREEVFDIGQAKFDSDTARYRDITAGKIILCNGTGGFDNNYFRQLPYTLNKGQALIVRIPGLPADVIYKQGLTIVPLNNELFWVGSSFEWEYEDAMPAAGFRKNAEATLSDWLKLPFTIIDHIAAIRPGSVERRPFIGIHPTNPSLGIMDGMGTKGCSLAPFFAHQFAAHLTRGVALDAAVNTLRYSNILSR